MINFSQMKVFFSKEKSLLFLIIVVALILRLFLAFNFEGTGDTGGWIQGGKTGLEGKDYGYGKIIYNKNCIGCPNWPPLTYHYLVLSRWSYLNLNPLQLPQWGFYKLLPVLGDTGIVALLYFIAKMKKIREALMLSAIYALHPIALYVSGYHGQKDSVWLFFLLFSVFLLEKKSLLLSSVILGLGISFKIPAIVYIPYILLCIPKIKQKILFFLILMSTITILNLPEIFQYPSAVWKQVILYKGWYGWWGLSGIATKIGSLTSIPDLAIKVYSLNKIILYGMLIYSSLYLFRKKVDIFLGIFAITITLLVFSPSFASQYLIWPLAFIVLFKDTYPKLFKFFTLYGIFFAMNFYGVFGVSFLEKILLAIPRENIYYKIPGLSYPMDLGFPLWIFFIYFLKQFINTIHDIKKD